MIYSLENTNLLAWFADQTGSCGIGHQCNCFHTMGAGIAKQISSRFPEALTADKKTKFGDKAKLGTFSVAEIITHSLKLIYNIYGQHEYGRTKRNTSYDALVEGLEKVRIHAITNGLTKLGIPYNMGCKLGGGNWAIVRVIISETFANDTDLDLYICKYET